MPNALPAVAKAAELREAWDLRNAATATLVRTERQLRRLLLVADAADVIALLETFSPARSPGPEWTRSFEPLLERLWEWCSPITIAAVEAEFRGRGPAWAAIANSLTPQRGEVLRSRVERRSTLARLPAFTIE
jgi:hypothetical protein